MATPQALTALPNTHWAYLAAISTDGGVPSSWWVFTQQGSPQSTFAWGSYSTLRRARAAARRAVAEGYTNAIVLVERSEPFLYTGPLKGR